MTDSAKTGAVALPDGLKTWVMGEGPTVWHAFASGVEFDHPDATIDVLLAADWIVRQPDTDRATSLLILAKALEAGLHIYAPKAMDDTAARAFCVGLHQRLALNGGEARMPLKPEDRARVERLFSAHALLPLPATSLKTGGLPCAFTFVANRPCKIAVRLRRAA
jgi:hypothetical protein